MLIGLNCKVGNKCNHEAVDFKFFEGVIASEPVLSEPDEFRVVLLSEGKLTVVDTYFMYDIGA